MWQKPARIVLEAHETVRGFVGFGFFCVFSGMLGFLLRECLNQKADWADKLSFGLLAMAMAVFYGLHVYGMVAGHGPRSHRILCGIKLFFWLASFIVGILWI